MGFLEKIKKLRPVSFNYRWREFPQYEFSREKEVGLIAQEVEKVFPEMVSGWKDGFKGIKYQHLPIYLLKAIQEQQKEIETLKKKVKKLLLLVK